MLVPASAYSPLSLNVARGKAAPSTCLVTNNRNYVTRRTEVHHEADVPLARTTYPSSRTWSLHAAAGMLDIRSNTEQIAQHYVRYVQELREFFKCSSLPFGAPEHLAGLTNRLREDEVFREEMYSMNRSIIFREGGALPPTELLRLLAAAVGGAAVDDHAEQHRPEIRYLLQFLTGVTRAPVNQPRAEASRPAAARPAPAIAPVVSGPDVGRTSGRWSGKPSNPSLRWAEIWNGSTMAGALQLFRSKRGWWIPASVAALASVSLLLWLPHSKVPPPVVSRSVPAVVASSPQVAAEPEAVQETVTRAAPLPVAARSFPRPRKASVKLRKRVDRRSHPERRPLAISIRQGKPSRNPKQRLVAHASVSARVAPRRQAEKQLRAELSPRSSSPSFSALQASNPRTSREERSLSDAHAASPNHRAVLDVSSGVMTTNLISAPAPKYPRLAGVMHLQGTVILQAVIDKNGQVKATSVLGGHRLLREAAVHAVRQWRYRPFLAEGHPVDVATVVTVDFRRQH